MDPSCTRPGSQPDDLRRSGQASVLSCLRGTRKVRGRYIAGGDSAVRQLEPSHAAQLQQDGGIPARVPRASNPTNERSGQPRPLCPSGKVSRSPGPLPQSSAHRLPGRPRSALYRRVGSQPPDSVCRESRSGTRTVTCPRRRRPHRDRLATCHRPYRMHHQHRPSRLIAHERHSFRPNHTSRTPAVSRLE